MRSITVLASLLATSTLVSAQAGRFFCSKTVNGVIQQDDAACVAPTHPQSGIPFSQGNGPIPVASQCIRDVASTSFFCGYNGAACDPTAVNTACDNGACVATDVLVPTVGVCQGFFGNICGASDNLCLGYIYCTDPSGNLASGTCGGLGSYCQDPDLSPVQAVFDATCASGYCNSQTAQCDVKVGLGGDCSSDPSFQCNTGLVCTAGVLPGVFTCLAGVGPSQRARTRRSIDRAGACPLSQTACKLPGSLRGYECIDTDSNLEQCGACASKGGVDCTAIKGVDAVGCVAGQCEVWACALSHTYDAASASCVPSAL